MRRGAASLAAVALTLAFGLAVAPRAGAGDGGPGAPPAPAPVAPATPTPSPPADPVAPAPAKDAAAPAPKSATADELEKRLFAHPGAFAAMLALKYGTAIAGLVALVLLLVRRREERRGLVAPSRPLAAPPRPFKIGRALLLAVVAVVAGPLVVEVVYRGLHGWRLDGGPMPLVWRIGSTAAGTIPMAAFIALALRGAWARRRAEGDAAVAESVFGDDPSPPSPAAVASPEFASRPTAPWPAREAWRAGGVGFLVASFLVLVVSALTVVAMTLLGAPAEPQGLVLLIIESKVEFDVWLIVGFGVLVAPITEEYLFRGMLYPAFRDGSSRFAGALVSSVIFGAVHQSWTAGPALFVLAFLLCRLYERTGSVWPGVLVHALNNATSLAPLLLLRYA